jgi:hypothetical protein
MLLGLGGAGGFRAGAGVLANISECSNTAGIGGNYHFSWDDGLVIPKIK